MPLPPSASNFGEGSGAARPLTAGAPARLVRYFAIGQDLFLVKASSEVKWAGVTTYFVSA
jgi:hypothetical protein